MADRPRDTTLASRRAYRRPQRNQSGNTEKLKVQVSRRQCERTRKGSGPGGRAKPIRLQYLGRSDFADAGFLRQGPDAADEAERVCELLPAGLKDRALRRRHELRRVAPRPHGRHGGTGDPRGETLAGARRLRSRPLTGAEAHLLGRDPLNTRTPKPLPPAFVIVSFGAFPLGSGLTGSRRATKSLRQQKQDPSAATCRPATRPSFPLPLPATQVAPWLLVRRSSALPTTPSCTARRPSRPSYWAVGEAAGPSGALFRRGGCVMRRGQRFYFRRAEPGPSLCTNGPEPKRPDLAGLPVSTSVSVCFQITTFSGIALFLVLSPLVSLSNNLVRPL